MSTQFIRSALAFAAALALLPASRAAAQRAPEAISAAELRARGTANLYEAVQALRPDWLLLAGDASDPRQAERLVVFVDGRHVGNVLALRGIQAGEVRSVRLRSQEFVRATIPRFPRTEFAAALFVATLSRQEAPSQGRVTLSLDGGVNLISARRIATRGLVDQGYSGKTVPTLSGFRPLEDPGAANPVSSVGASLHYAAREKWGVALTAQHTLEGWAGGYQRETARVVSAMLTSTEGAVLLTRDARWARLGIGPSFRMLDWSWARGSCRCSDEESFSTSAFGAAADVKLMLPVGSRVVPHLRLQARYYLNEETEYSVLQDPVDAGGLVITLSGGLSAHFF
jgi:hypothetical protein